MLEETNLAANTPCTSRRAAVIARLCKLLRPVGQRDEVSAGCLLCPCVEPEAECCSTIGRQQAVLKFWRESTSP